MNDDMDIFNSTTSGDGDAANVPETIVTPAAAEPAPSNRDEAGRFASQQAPEPTAPAEPTPDNSPSHGVPVAAVQAEREKRKQAESELAELRGMVKALQAQRQPEPKPEAQPATLWDNPDEYLKGQITPVQQQLQEMREEMWESTASAVHSVDAVQAAKEAAQALAGTPQGKALHQQIMAGGNPFDNLVKWHKQQQSLQRVGTDPDAWFQAEYEKRLADPAEQAKILERIRGAATASPSRSQSPITNIPPSLSKLPSGGNTASGGEQSDEGMFASITTRRR